jgi:hypothetical protein
MAALANGLGQLAKERKTIWKEAAWSNEKAGTQPS